jgi:hypothetical protein
MLFLLIDAAGDDGSGPIEVVPHHSWVTGRSQVNTADGLPSNGDAMTLLTDTSDAAVNAVQATAADRPTWRPTTFPGRGAFEVTATDHFDAAVTAPIRLAVVIANSGVRGLLSRDTSATTDHPAFYLRVTEDFG